MSTASLSSPGERKAGSSPPLQLELRATAIKGTHLELHWAPYFTSIQCCELKVFSQWISESGTALLSTESLATCAELDY